MRVVLNYNHSYGNDYLCSSTKPDYDLVIEAAVDSIKELYANNNALKSLFKVFDNNVAANELRSYIKKLNDTNNDLVSLFNEDSNNIDIYNQIEHNNEKIKVLKHDLVESVSSSVRLYYIKSLVKEEHFNASSIILKDIYSLVIADDQKIVFAISPTKSRDSLMSSYHDIVLDEGVLKKCTHQKMEIVESIMR